MTDRLIDHRIFFFLGLEDDELITKKTNKYRYLLHYTIYFFETYKNTFCTLF